LEEGVDFIVDAAVFLTIKVLREETEVDDVIFEAENFVFSIGIGLFDAFSVGEELNGVEYDVKNGFEVEDVLLAFVEELGTDEVGILGFNAFDILG
jgi:hypothetical protein